MSDLSMFSPKQLFNAMDINESRWLEDSDILAFSDRVGLTISHEDAIRIVTQYATDRMSYDNFLNFALPATDDHLRELAQRRDTMSRAHLNGRVETAVRDLILSELNF